MADRTIRSATLAGTAGAVAEPTRGSGSPATPVGRGLPGSELTLLGLRHVGAVAAHPLLAGLLRPSLPLALLGAVGKLMLAIVHAASLVEGARRWPPPQQPAPRPGWGRGRGCCGRLGHARSGRARWPQGCRWVLTEPAPTPRP